MLFYFIAFPTHLLLLAHFTFLSCFNCRMETLARSDNWPNDRNASPQFQSLASISHVTVADRIRQAAIDQKLLMERFSGKLCSFPSCVTFLSIHNDDVKHIGQGLVTISSPF
jgi:hypothetical protein